MRQATQKQLRVLSFIERYRRKNGMPPSFQEMAAHFGYSSLNSVYNHIRFLRKKGLLVSQKGPAGHKKRSLVSLLPLPPAAVPLVGRIAAGAPLEAIENVERAIDLTDLGIDNSGGGYFALLVRGDSMVNAHILDGDLVVVKKQPEAGPGEIAAVLWNGEATLKYVKRRGNAVFLAPANDAMKPLAVDPAKTDAFEILGKVVKVIREV